MCATTLGETAGDLMSMTLSIGYGSSSLILITPFFVSQLVRLDARCFHLTFYCSLI
ncbi:hypothetical protein [Zhongshania aliphaticivorans]|uniref:hypothetical protein n=1 Tax=Zhongshania aliphaticivorans TaxID=1470434 RepID=UPI0039C98827